MKNNDCHTNNVEQYSDTLTNLFLWCLQIIGSGATLGLINPKPPSSLLHNHEPHFLSIRHQNSELGNRRLSFKCLFVRDPKLAITVPADALAHNDALVLAGTVMMEKLAIQVFFLNSNHSVLSLTSFKMANEVSRNLAVLWVLNASVEKAPV